MFESLKIKCAELKYEWQHSPKRQRSSLIAIGVILIGLCCGWFALAQVEENVLGAKNGNVFAPPEQAQTSDLEKSQPEAQEPTTAQEPEKTTKDSTSPQKEPAIDISVVEVQTHAPDCAKIDKLPRVAAEQAARCEQTIQALLVGQKSNAKDAKIYLDQSRSISLVAGETEKVTFTVQVVDASDKQLMQLEMAYTPKTKSFGIINALKPATPPEDKKEA